MVVFPNAKINIGLYITEKRTDGYHNLESVFYPVAVRDALELIPWYSESEEQVQYSHSGLPVQGQVGDNLCLKAWQLLQKRFPLLPAIQLHLHKAIPMGAGLGGGSSDGAHMLTLLNRRFNLELDTGTLLSLALELGSDCPFFILNTPCLANGRGEILQPIPLDLGSYEILLVNPGIHVPTGRAFTTITPQPTEGSLAEWVMAPVDTWKGKIINQFEAPVIQAHPEIGELKQALYDAGAVYASMSGSGSTVYGLFHRGQLPELRFPSHYFSFRG